jgi:dihydrofolate reductase
MIISLIVAASENNAIGKNNQLLWNLPNDMTFFKNTTWGMPVIMGRKTYESMTGDLKGRTNIVLTRKRGKGPHLNEALEAASLDEAIQIAKRETDAKEIFIIGGGEIFKMAMPVANRIYMTRVHAHLEGDTFFPAINEAQWKLVSSNRFEADQRHAHSYTFETWERIKNG